MKVDGDKERLSDDGSREGNGQQRGEGPRESPDLEGTEGNRQQRGEGALGGQGCVYFIETNDGAFVKIGYSRDVRVRFSQVAALLPGLRLVGYMPGNKRTERGLHSKFAAHRERGEWFRQVEEIREFITSGCNELAVTMPPSYPRASKVNEPTFVDVSAMGRKGGKARAANLSPEERSESARKAVQARWAGVKKAAAKKTAKKKKTEG